MIQFVIYAALRITSASKRKKSGMNLLKFTKLKLTTDFTYQFYMTFSERLMYVQFKSYV